MGKFPEITLFLYSSIALLILFPIFVSKFFPIKNINIDIILGLLERNDGNTLRIDDINSSYQKASDKRLFMFDMTSMKKGKIAKNDIIKYLKDIEKNKK